MRITYSSILITLIVLLTMIKPSFGETAISGATILLQDLSTRFTALGGSQVAWQGSADVLLANPAGISRLKDNDIKLTHIAGIEGLTTEVAIGALPFPDGGVVGFQAIYRSSPTIDNEGATDAPIESKELIFGAAVGIPFTKELSLGLQAKVVRLLLGPVDAANIAIDIGGQYQLAQAWRVALAVQNLGPDIEWRSVADPMPLIISAGVHYLVVDQEKYNLQAGLDLKHLVPEQLTSVHLGAELIMEEKIVLRLGGKFASETNAANFAAGLGFYFKLFRMKWALDYTFSPEFWDNVDLELKNLISLSIMF